MSLRVSRAGSQLKKNPHRRITVARLALRGEHVPAEMLDGQQGVDAGGAGADVEAGDGPGGGGGEEGDEVLDPQQVVETEGQGRHQVVVGDGDVEREVLVEQGQGQGPHGDRVPEVDGDFPLEVLGGEPPEAV